MRRSALLIVLVFLILPTAVGSVRLGSGVPQNTSHTQIISPETSQRWKIKPGRTMETSPVVANGVVYVTMAGCVCAIDATTGEVKWRGPDAGYGITSPLIWNGLVIYGGWGGALEALDADTGVVSWAYGIRNARDDYSGPPVAEDGLVYFGSGWSDYAAVGGGSIGHITALDAMTGKVIWQKEMSGSQGGGGLAVADGTLYFGNGDEHKYDADTLHAVDAKTGADKWVVNTSYDLGDIYILDEDILYVASREHLVAFDAHNGKVLWKRDGNGKGLSDPALGDGKLYLIEMDYQFCFEGCKDPIGTHPDHLLALDAKTGEEQMRVDIGDTDPNRVVLLQGILYYNLFEPNQLHAVDPATGDLLWTFQAAEPLWGDPAVATGILFVGEGNGTLHALQLPVSDTPTEPHK